MSYKYLAQGLMMIFLNWEVMIFKSLEYLSLLTFTQIMSLNDKGKPFERMGRKANGLKTFESKAAGLPNFG